jgi:hypothetical protein
MRIAEIEFIKSLSKSQVSNIIPVLEKGLEIQKLEYIATQDINTGRQISDTCILLSFLYFRQLGNAA